MRNASVDPLAASGAAAHATDATRLIYGHVCGTALDGDIGVLQLDSRSKPVNHSIAAAGELGHIRNSIPRSLPQILSDSPSDSTARRSLLSLFLDPVSPSSVVANMSSADAKPLPFVYQFAAGKFQLPTPAEAAMRRLRADKKSSSCDSSHGTQLQE